MKNKNNKHNLFISIDEKFTNIIEQFFSEYLINQLNASENTISSYRTCIKFFLRHLSNNGNKEIIFSMFTAESICNFLSDYSKEKQLTARSRNQRLAILKSLAKFSNYLYPDSGVFLGRINLIKRQRENIEVLDYLDFKEMNYILDLAQNDERSGGMHYAILLFMYNTGARVSEVTSLNIDQLNLNSLKIAKIHGKGNKNRPVPLWVETIVAIKSVIKNRINEPSSPVF